MRQLSAALAACAALHASPVTAAEDEPEETKEHRLSWTFPRFSVLEYGITATLFTQLAFIEYRTEQPKEPRWTGPILFDEAVRNGTRLKSRSGRDVANAISNPTTLILQIIPVTVEGLAVPLFFDDFNWDVAWQMTMVNALGLGAQGFLQRLSLRTAARERPDVEPCRDDPEYSDHCGRGKNASFYSGHIGGAMAGAGMMCAHHLHMPLFGHEAADIVACALPFTAATATGVLRLLGDRHYLSDVLIGGGVGFVTGYGLPVLLHYGQGTHPNAVFQRVAVTPLGLADRGGLALTGAW